MPKYVPKSTAYCCALVAGLLCTATEAEGQERVAPPGASATVRAAATILPSLDAASFAGVPRDLSRLAAAPSRRGMLVVSAPRPTDGATVIPAWVEPPVARSFERFALGERSALRHTIAVLY